MQVEELRERARVESAIEARDELFSLLESARESPALADLLYEAGRDLGLERYNGLGTRLDGYELAERAAALADNTRRAMYVGQLRTHLLRDNGRLGEALDEASRLIDAYPDEAFSIPFLWTTRAGLERQLGRYDDSLASLDEAEALIGPDDAKQAPLRAAIPGLRGQVYLNLGLPDLAAPWLREEMAVATELYATDAKGFAGQLVWAQRRTAALALATGDYDGGVELIEGFLARKELYAKRGRDRGYLLSLLGVALLRAGESDDDDAALAAQRQREALELKIEPIIELRARLRLAEAEMTRGELDLAEEALAGARAQIDQLAGDPERPAPVHEAAQLVAFESRLAFARGGAGTELRALRDEAREGLELLIEDWQHVPERAGGVGFLLYSTRRAVLGELFRLEVAVEGPERGAELALEHVVSVQAMSTLARRGTAQPPDLAALRAELLDERRGLLIYLPARGVSHVLAVDRERVLHLELASSEEIRLARVPYVSHLTAYAGDVPDEERDWLVEEERRLASELAQLLFPPTLIDVVASWNGVTIVGADMLGFVPFAWLPLGAERHLGAERAVDFLPSLAIDVDASTPDLAGAPELVLVGGVRPDPDVAARFGVGALELSQQTADRLASPYGSASVLRGDGATREALRAATADGAGVLQFLVHAVRDRTRERPTLLVLAPGDTGTGLFGYDDVVSVAPPALVLLTSCRSAAARIRPGDPGITDLGGAWLANGARAALLSQVDLDYAWTIEVSERLHARLRDGLSPAEALRRMRADLVRDHGEAAPFHSGLLTLVGNGHAPLFAPREVPPASGTSRWWLLAPFGLVVLLLLLPVLQRSRRS